MLGGLSAQERRSAVQVPEQSPEPAVHMPEPSVADRRPWPLALVMPRETVHRDGAVVADLAGYVERGLARIADRHRCSILTG